jgi:uncharacterized protein
MNATLSTQPLIKAGWLRALLYILALSVAAGILLAGMIFGILKNHPGASALAELKKGSFPAMIALIFFALTLTITYVFCRWIDRRSLGSLGFEINGHGQEALAGAAFAVFIIGSSCLINQLTGHLKWMDILFDPKSLFLALGATLLSAFYEELIFRGYLLNNLMQSFPKWLALVISALLFMGFHWNSSGLFPLLNMLVLGLITGLFYLYTGNLWFPIFFHTAWKFMAGPILGFTDDPSSQSLLQATVRGDENITGGASGLEGSVILTAVSLLSAVALYFILQKKISPKFQPAQGRI